MKKSWLLVFGLLPLVVQAKIDVDPADKTVTPGVWCGNFHSATNYATSHNLPFVYVWGEYNTGSGECPNCAALTAALKTPAAMAWAASKRAVFCFVEGHDWQDDVYNKGAYVFARQYRKEDGTLDKLSTAPFVHLELFGSKKVHFTGTSGTMYSRVGSTLFDQFKNSVELFLSEITIPVSYADFPMGDFPCDRLEAVVGQTAYVDVPLVRTNDVDQTATCLLTYVANGQTTIHTVNWAAGEAMKFDRFDVPAGCAAGQQIGVTLKESDGATVLATRHIWCVSAAERENSSKNPYWFGEKTAETLAWGEWSMDLDAVTNKVRVWNAKSPAKKGYAMVLVAGSCWCPDCAMADTYVYDNLAFKAWASEHQVVFGVLDIPRRTTADDLHPSLLRYETERLSDAYVTLRTSAPANEDLRYQSGAGYLSRHSVPYEGNGGTNALAIAARNAFLVGHHTSEGGLNNKFDKLRTGVPVMLLLRDDGTVAARWNRFSDAGPTGFSEGYLRRFEEMLAQVDEPDEERDDSSLTTTRTLPSAQPVEATVSMADLADVYAVTAAVGKVLNLTFENRGTGTLKLTTSNGNLTWGGVSTNCLLVAPGETIQPWTRIDVPGGSVTVAPEVKEGTFFWYTTQASTVCPYALSATSAEACGTFKFAQTSLNVKESDGRIGIEVERVNGTRGAASVTVVIADIAADDARFRIVWPPEGKVLNWGAGEGGSKTEYLELKDDDEVNDGFSVTFALVEPQGAASDISVDAGGLTVNVEDDDIVGEYIYRNLWREDRHVLGQYRSGDRVELVCKSGALPAGMSARVVDGTVVVSGHPTEKGVACSEYEARIYRSGVLVGTETLSLDYTVGVYDFSNLVPSVNTERSYGGLPHVVDAAVVGLLTVSVPPNGQVSAKYSAGGRSYAFSANGWSTCDFQSGRLTAEAARTDGASQALSVVLTAAGGRVAFDDPLGTGTIEFALVQDWPAGAGAYRGQYTVQMPQTNMIDNAGANKRNGAAYMAFRMNSDDAIAEGRVLYGGVLPNGRAFYGNALLTTNSYGVAKPEGDCAFLPFYHFSDMKSAPYVFSGGLAIKADAQAMQDDADNRWTVGPMWTPQWATGDGLSHASEFGAFGGYYNRDRISAYFREDMSGAMDNLAFYADTEALLTGRYGQPSALSPVGARITDEDAPELNDDTNPQEVELEFSQETGVISGSFVIPFAGRPTAVTFRGIALPGWQACADCKAPGSAYVERPWAVGACSLSDKFGSVGTVRNCCEIRLDKASK